MQIIGQSGRRGVTASPAVNGNFEVRDDAGIVALVSRESLSKMLLRKQAGVVMPEFNLRSIIAFILDRITRADGTIWLVPESAGSEGIIILDRAFARKCAEPWKTAGSAGE